MPAGVAFHDVAYRRCVRIYIWHGYLLHGTGSNEYTQALTRTLAYQGHDVTVFCQDEAGDLDLGGARVRRPPLPGRLPVFVLDKYEGLEAALLRDFDRAEIDAFITAQVRSMSAEGPADLLITNHVVLGGPVGAASGLPFVVKAHGSELEYAMRGNDLLCEWAAESLRQARAVIAGSEHIETVLEDLVEVDRDKVVVIPPGVATDQMRPKPRAQALQDLLAEARADQPNPAEHYNERLPDHGNAARIAEFLDGDEPLVTYVGKLSREKGVSLLIDALQGSGAKAMIVGFGPERAALQAQAERRGVRALFTGPLQHRHLSNLWPLADVSVVPSVFPEAFGMVAAEAASCGCPPLVARHSGLAEIAAGIEQFLPPRLHLVSYESGKFEQLQARLRTLLNLSDDDRATLRAGCRRAVEELWSWDSIGDEIVKLGVAA